MVGMRRRDSYILITPLALVVLALVAFPTLYSYYASLFGVHLSDTRRPFVGMDNYINMLTNPSFYHSVFYSLKFSVLATLVEIILGIGLAVLMNRSFKGKGISTSLILLPMMVAPSLFALIFRLGLNEFVGIIPYYLKMIGIDQNPFDPEWVNTTLIAIDALQWIPFVFIIIYAGLTTIPEDIYEASHIDGASPVQAFFTITLPMLVPSIATAAFLRGIDAFKIYDMIYVLTNGGPGESTTSVSMFIYKKAFLDGDLGGAAAASLLLSLILAFPLSLAMKYVLKKEGQ
ncbi:sugar ABC transporter permease [Paenibacillus oryzisoli]|uniref:carbohydrate ABC transporter permease n=1 Tax=Paenibacillus oryzisoli TaxID=1850517 RepID=UPI003D2AE47F